VNKPFVAEHPHDYLYCQYRSIQLAWRWIRMRECILLWLMPSWEPRL